MKTESNWIYPGNVSMLDGERMVERGRHAEENVVHAGQDRGIASTDTREIEESAVRGLDIAPLVEKARSHAVNGTHARKLEALCRSR